MVGKSSLFVLSVLLLVGGGPAEAGNRNEPEWKGMFQYSGEYRFSVRPPGSDGALWLKIGDLRRGLQLIAYDAKGKTLEVEYRGERKHLRLAEADGRPVPVQVSSNVSVAEARASHEAPEKRRPVRRRSVAAPAAERPENPSRARLRSIRLDRSSADEPIISESTRAREASARATAEQPSAKRNARRLPRQKDEADGG